MLFVIWLFIVEINNIMELVVTNRTNGIRIPLWDIIVQNGPDFIGMYGSSHFSEYGTAAVGTLIR